MTHSDLVPVQLSLKKLHINYSTFPIISLSNNLELIIVLNFSNILVTFSYLRIDTLFDRLHPNVTVDQQPVGDNHQCPLASILVLAIYSGSPVY